MKSDYVASAVIRSDPEVVWRILTDATGYAAWNPEIISIEGNLAAGARIMARVKLGDGTIRTVPMRVTTFTPTTRMVWTGGLPLGLFVGIRDFTVTPHSNGTEFRMHLTMRGLLAPLILKSVGDRQPEIDRFAAALKAHVER